MTAEALYFGSVMCSMATYYPILTHVSTSIGCVSGNAFSDWLNDQLRRREWSESDLARRIGTKPSVVNRWTRGERVPSTKSIDLIADVLSADFDSLLTLAGHRPTTEPLRPDDPAVRVIDLVKRLRNDPEFLEDLEVMLRARIDRRRAASRGASASDRA